MNTKRFAGKKSSIWAEVSYSTEENLREAVQAQKLVFALVFFRVAAAAAAAAAAMDGFAHGLSNREERKMERKVLSLPLSLSLSFHCIVERLSPSREGKEKRKKGECRCRWRLLPLRSGEEKGGFVAAGFRCMNAEKGFYLANCA